MKAGKAGVAGLVLAVCLAGNSYADRRSYVWSYEYSTMPQGIAEAEYYLTTKVPDVGDRQSSSWKHEFELEYGLTDNWDAGIYQVFSQNHGTNSTSEFGYEGFKVKTRYKFFKKDEFIVDPLIYVEYIRNSNLSDPDVLEVKLVLAKDLGNFNVVYNAIVERELDGDAETVHEYTAGVKYAVTSAFSAGIESKGSYDEGEYAVGPVISFETDKLWFALGAILGLNDKTEDMRARLIVGLAL